MSNIEAKAGLLRVESSSKIAPLFESNTVLSFLTYFSFVVFGLILLVGACLNLWYLWWSRYRASPKGCNNAFLQSIAIANLILLVIALPMDALYLIYGTWVFNQELCSIYHIVTRSMFFTIASILVQYTRDSYQPFGFLKGKHGLSTSWVIGVVPFVMLYFTELKVERSGSIRCIPNEKGVFALPMCIGLEMFYIAIFPALTLIFYKNKYQLHHDYNNKFIAGADDNGKIESRGLCAKLSVIIMVCYLPWRLIVVCNLEWAYNYMPMHMIIFGLLPVTLSYSLTIAFPIMITRAARNPLRLAEDWYDGQAILMCKKNFIDSLEKKKLLV